MIKESGQNSFPAVDHSILGQPPRYVHRMLNKLEKDYYRSFAVRRQTNLDRCLPAL